MSRDVVVVGAGFVGLVTALTIHHVDHVTLLEANPERVRMLSGGVVPFSEPGVAELWKSRGQGRIGLVPPGSAIAMEAMAEAALTVVCVPTPSAMHGYDSGAVMQVAEAWAKANANMSPNPEIGHLVIKSTVTPAVINELDSHVRKWIPGFLGVVHVPEFLAEGTALSDARRPSRVVIGWPTHSRRAAAEPSARDEALVECFDPNGDAWHGFSREAAMVKLSSNTLLATRLSVVQELAGLCERYGMDWGHVSTAVGRDRRIGSAFLEAGSGWGGSCFPKDTLATAMMDPDGCQTILAASQSNSERTMWAATKTIDAIREAWDHEKDKGRDTLRLLWLGLAFKPGTSDTRESPSVHALHSVVGQVRGLGIPVRIYAFDPEAELPASLHPEVVSVGVGGLATLEMLTVDVVVVATAWPEFTHEEISRYKPFCAIMARGCRGDVKRVGAIAPEVYAYGRPSVISP